MILGTLFGFAAAGYFFGAWYWRTPEGWAFEWPAEVVAHALDRDDK